jgi:predicted porin
LSSIKHKKGNRNGFPNFLKKRQWIIMKKTLLALSVLVAAGSVNAAEVYNKDGFTLSVYGDAEVKYVSFIEDDSEATMVLGDSDFGFAATSAVNDDWTAYTKIEFDGDDDAADDGYNVDPGVNLDDLYVGVKGSNGFYAQFGKQITIVDEIGISNDYQFGLDTAENLAGNVDSGNQTAWVGYSNDMFNAALSWINKADADSDTDDLSQIGIRVGTSLAGADITAWYADQDGGDTGTDVTTMALKAAYTIDIVTLSALYSTAEANDTVDYDSIAGNVEVGLDMVTLNLGYAANDSDAAAGDYSQWYANAIYALTPASNIVLELSDKDTDNTDMGYSLGMTFAF